MSVFGAPVTCVAALNVSVVSSKGHQFDLACVPLLNIRSLYMAWNFLISCVSVSFRRRTLLH